MKARPLLERFLEKIEITESCWIWKAHVDKGGYARIGEKSEVLYAHRVAYELFVGPIPEDRDVDHQCHNADKLCKGGKTCPHRRCVCPDHLEPAVRQVNASRGRCGQYQAERTHCPQGHEYTPENIYGDAKHRTCKTCAIARARARYKAKI